MQFSFEIVEMADCELSFERDKQTMANFDSTSPFSIIKVIDFDSLYLFSSNKNIDKVVTVNYDLSLFKNEQTFDCMKIIANVLKSLKLRIELPTTFCIVDNINTFFVMKKFGHLLT